jgi:hypothetical protein
VRRLARGLDRIEQLEEILCDWLVDPKITLVCGDWRAGSIMELFPAGRATLTRARYPEPFHGVRDLKLAGEAHHVHLDLGKLSSALYTVAPSVCYGYRPSFEVRFAFDGGDRFSLAVSLSEPYTKRGADRSSMVRYFERLLDHRTRFPLVTRFRCEPATDSQETECWKDALACLAVASGQEIDLGRETPNARGLQGAVDRLFARPLERTAE